MTRIAYLGGGAMARAMAGRHLDAGAAVVMYNRTPERLAGLAERGAQVAASPRAAVEGAEAVFSSVTDDAASRALWTGPEGALEGDIAPGALLVEQSTLSHEWVLELAGVMAGRGLRFIDAPVAGRPDAAAAGKLTIFAGGVRADVEALRSLAAPIGTTLFHFGAAGAGTAFKLIYNLMGAVQIVALAEALAAAEAAGIDLAEAARAFSGGGTGSAHVARHAPAMALGLHEDPPGFTAKGRLKDSTYGVALEEKLGQAPGVGRAARDAYRAMVEAGMGDEADSRVIQLMRPHSR